MEISTEHKEHKMATRFPRSRIPYCWWPPEMRLCNQLRLVGDPIIFHFFFRAIPNQCWISSRVLRPTPQHISKDIAESWRSQGGTCLPFFVVFFLLQPSFPSKLVEANKKHQPAGRTSNQQKFSPLDSLNHRSSFGSGWIKSSIRLEVKISSKACWKSRSGNPGKKGGVQKLPPRSREWSCFLLQEGDGVKWRLHSL